MTDADEWPDGTVIRDAAGHHWWICSYRQMERGKLRPRRAVPADYGTCTRPYIDDERVIMLLSEFIAAHPDCRVVFAPGSASQAEG